MKLDIIELHVSNWKQSLDWWVSTLGLKIIVREDAHKFALLKGRGGAMIGLYGAPSPGTQRFTPYFKVGNLDKMVSSLQRSAVLTGEIEKTHWGRQVKVTDREGNDIFLYQEKRDF